MARRRIPLFDLQLSAKAAREVNAVMKLGWLNTGPRVGKLERAIADMVGVRHAVALNSASAGLQLTLEVLGAGSGGEVITTPFTYVATIAAILRAGGRPVLADIDPATLNVDPDDIARKVGSRSVCILPVDIGGHPAPYPELRRICRHFDLPLVADATHSLGATRRGKSTTRLVDAAVHSFQATKNLTTGDGGMVISRQKRLVDRVRLFSQHAVTKNAQQRRQSRSWEYDVVAVGMKANMTDLQAAVGLGQLSTFGKNQKLRMKLASRYIENLEDLHDYMELPHTEKHCEHAWHLFIIRLHLSRLKINRDRFISLMSEAGVECGVHYKPIFEFGFYRELGFLPQNYPNAAYAGKRVVTLPLYPTLKLTDVDYICDRVRRILRTNAH